MKLATQKTLVCDVLVVGSGGAGLRSAIAAKTRHADVLLVSKYKTGRTSNTYFSKAIIAASGWGPPEDNPDLHTQDTIQGGRFLNDRAKVSTIAERIGPEIGFLQTCGVNFGMEQGRLRILKTPGHRHPRHVHAKNWAGSDLIFPLIAHARKLGVNFQGQLFITRLLTSAGRVAGAAGEATAGAHGANRLGGNALAEVFSIGALTGGRCRSPGGPFFLALTFPANCYTYLSKSFNFAAECVLPMMTTQPLHIHALFEIDNKGRRSGIDRRQFSYAVHIPERRSGNKRRSGEDRRNRLR